MDEATPKQNALLDKQAAASSQSWSLRDLLFAGETQHSRFYSCQSDEHGPALLKTLTADGLLIEAGGFEVLSKYAFEDAVKIFAFDQTTALMEVLEGPRLLDIIDDGQADVALEIQLSLTDRLLAADVSVAGLKSLEMLMAKSLSMDETDIPDWTMDVVPRAQSLCRGLLRDQSTWVALHGDLHPRNIMMHKGSWRALDARGIYGPAAFEYANTFINPWDRKALIFKEGRMEALVEGISRRLSRPVKTVAEAAIANALYYAHLGFQSGQGRHPTKCIRKLLEFAE